MRTVTFAAPAVKQLLNNSFVCAVMNTTGDPTAGESFSHAPKDPPGQCLRGNGEHNVQILVMTPTGELFHALSGYIGPDELEQELSFSLDTYASLRRDPNNAKRIIGDQHERFLKQRGFTDDEIHRDGLNPLSGFANFDQLATRSVSPTSGQFSLDRMFEGFSRPRILSDHRFSMEHPMLPVSEFRPEMLV